MSDDGHLIDALSATARELVDLDARVGGQLVAVLGKAYEDDGSRSPYIGSILQIAMGIWMICECGEDTAEEPFAVKDELWEEAYGDAMPRRNPCLLCFEDELGRDLEPGDFADDPVNEDPTSPRLRQRMGLPG